MAAHPSHTPALLLTTILLLLLLHVQLSQPCLCSILRNFKCPSAPSCCESGQYTLDECGCCQKCAKAELQKCGGASDISGKCAGGLQCLKTCLPCKTVGDAGRPCIFPFKYVDKTYDKCTSKDSDNGQPWCATEVDEEGYVVDNAWGDCLEGCPGTRLECDDKYFSIQEGKCIDISVPGAIPNWFGAPAVKLESATRDLFSAPSCKSKKGTVRLYDNTCRCVRGESAIDLGNNGLVRGNCTGLEDDNTDNLDKVWCFLENIRDPLNPSSGCYSDTKWSERDARFWSSLACFQAPDIEGGERATISRGFSNSLDSPYRPTTRRPYRPPTTQRTTTTTVRTTTTTEPVELLKIGEIEQYTDGEEHFYFSEYYQDYQEEIDSKISDTKEESRLSDYEDINRDDLHNNELANPTKLDDKSYAFIVGETNLPGFGRDEIPKGTRKSSTTTTTTTTQEPLPVRQIGPFLPTPSPIIRTTTKTSNRRNLLRNRYRNRSRRPPNANPRRKPSTPAPNKRVLVTRFPNFRRRPQILRRTSERPRVTTTNLPKIDELDYLAESPRSFLEGEFGENNIPIAIPLFENGELSDDIFKKIKKPIDKGANKIPLPPVPPFGSVLAKVETETVKVDKESKKKRQNFLKKIPTQKITPKPQKEIESGLLDLFGDIDVGLNEVKPQAPIALPLILEEGSDLIEDDHKTTVPSVKPITSNTEPITPNTELTQAVSQQLNTSKTDIIISLDDPIATNVFKYLPTLSTGRRDHPPVRSANTEPDIHLAIKEDEQEIITKTQNKAEIEADGVKEMVLLKKLTTALPRMVNIKTTPVKIEKSTNSATSVRAEKFISGSAESPALTANKKKTKKAPEDNIHRVNADEPQLRKQTEIQINLKPKPIDQKTKSSTEKVVAIKESSHPTITTSEMEEKQSQTVVSDTALLSESLKNIVRSGITNQDGADKKAISEELKNIVRSGILDLGILGLWGRDPIVPANTSPMPVFRPASVRRVN